MGTQTTPPGKNPMTPVNRSPKTTKHIATTVAGITVEKVAGDIAGKVAGKVGGVLVEPAVWVVTGDAPDVVDVGLWGIGATGPIGAIAAAATGLIKALVEDEIKRCLLQARSSEPAKYRDFIFACSEYDSWAGQFINATTIASRGGTVWLHPNGLWVYIADGRKRLVADYPPQMAKKIFQPLLPLVPMGGGRYKWHQVRG